MNIINKVNKYLLCFLLLIIGSCLFAENNKKESWLELYSISGRCKMLFPDMPQHLKQKIPSKDGKYLDCDIYVVQQKKNVSFFLVIAHYSSNIEKEKYVDGLKNFLSGIMSHGQDNELVTSSFAEVEEYPSLDFLIHSKGNLLKGRTVIAENKLYLIAVECDQKNYKDKWFDKFVKSFNFVRNFPFLRQK